MKISIHVDCKASWHACMGTYQYIPKHVHVCVWMSLQIRIFTVVSALFLSMSM